MSVKYYEIDSFHKQKLNRKHHSPSILIVGAGSLGNHVLLNLSQTMQSSHIIIVDFDTIEAHNIPLSPLFNLNDAKKGLYKAQVAAERIKKINPEINVTPLIGDAVLDIGLGIFQRVDLVISCVDNRLARLYINRYCHLSNTPWINGGVGKEEGDVEVFSPAYSCYECQLTPIERSEIRLRMSCTDLYARYADSQPNPGDNHIAAKVAELQVLEASKLLEGTRTSDSYGKLIRYNKAKSTVDYLSYAKEFESSHLKRVDGRPLCMTKGPLASVISLTDLHHQLTVKELFGILQLKFQSKQLKLYLNHPLIIAQNKEAGKRTFLRKPLPVHRLQERDAESYEISWEECFDSIDANFAWPHLTLKELGVASGDILELWTENEKVWIELSKDLDQIFKIPSIVQYT